MNPTTFDELGRRERQRLAVRSAPRIMFSTTILIVLYMALPAVSRSGAKPIIELLAGLLVFSGMLAWQVKSIIDAEHPEVRAIESLAISPGSSSRSRSCSTGGACRHRADGHLRRSHRRAAASRRAQHWVRRRGAVTLTRGG